MQILREFSPGAPDLRKLLKDLFQEKREYTNNVYDQNAGEKRSNKEKCKDSSGQSRESQLKSQNANIEGN